MSSPTSQGNKGFNVSNLPQTYPIILEQGKNAKDNTCLDMFQQALVKLITDISN